MVSSGAALDHWRRPWRVRVVVPARNEEELVGSCLDSVRRAAWQLRQLRPQVEVSVTIALDSCTDGTADQVLRRPDVAMVTVQHGLVGAARAAAVARATATDHDRELVWLANTDADTEVPENWLTVQLALADEGVVATVGTVQPRPEDLPPDVRARWHARHQTGDGHGHVHGANLGVRLDWYDAVGGFAAVSEHEDVQLVHRLAAAGGLIGRTGACRVRTSGRLRGRTGGGFAAYLADLEPVCADLVGRDAS